MSLPSTYVGHSIPDKPAKARLLITLVSLGGFCLHPVASIRRRRSERRHPNASEFRAMGPERFGEYVRATGIEDRIKRALAEGGGSGEQTPPDERVPAGSSRPES